MALRDRLLQIQESGSIVELYFGTNQSLIYYGKILQVENDYVEFEAYSEDHETVVAHNIMPMSLFTGATLDSLDMSRRKLEKSLKASREDKRD